MKKFAIITLTIMFGLCMAAGAFAGPKEDAVTQCKAAAAMIKAKGLDAAKAEINKKDGKFVVKDSTYVFLMDMTGTMLGHPFKPSLCGKNLKDTPDKAGKKFFSEMIDVAKKGEGWVDYMWPKPGVDNPVKKTSYILKVDDNTFVGAGYYLN